MSSCCPFPRGILTRKPRARKAASPDKYTIKDQIKKLYPLLQGIEERHPQSTSVHLQVYDGIQFVLWNDDILKFSLLGACHVLPVLFLFSTPAKYCFRAMARFTRFVTGMPLTPTTASSLSMPIFDRATSSPEIKRVGSPEPLDDLDSPPANERQISSATASVEAQYSESSTPNDAPSIPRKKSLTRALSARVVKAGRVLRRQSHNPIREGDAENQDSTTSSDVAGPRFKRTTSTKKVGPQERRAGEPSVYEDIEVRVVFGLISVC